MTPRVVLDATALLAFRLGERGADTVKEAIIHGAAIGAVNLAEALSKLAERGREPDEAIADLVASGLLGQAIAFFPSDERDAIEIAKLRPTTRSRGLSIGDRACLALARRLKLPALTSDRAWKDLEKAHGVKVELFRSPGERKGR